MHESRKKTVLRHNPGIDGRTVVGRSSTRNKALMASFVHSGVVAWLSDDARAEWFVDETIGVSALDASDSICVENLG